MHIFGYEHAEQPITTVASGRLAEVTLNATADELRLLAEFFRACADEMEQMGGSFDHVHLSDRFPQFKTAPHFVVACG